MTIYKEQLRKIMEVLAQDRRTIFLGYGVRTGGRALGTLINIAEEQLLETSVAENLMIGLAIGLSLKGRRPIVFIERMDFILNAADAIVNHLDKIEKISDGAFRPAVIIRCVVGNREKPLFTGETHIQNFSATFSRMLSFPSFCLRKHSQIAPVYHDIFRHHHSALIVEFKDLH